METIQSMLPLLVSIILFVITLILIFALRAEDRKSRKLDLVKRYVTQHQAEMAQSVEHFRHVAESTEDAMAKQQREIALLVERLDQQQQSIQDHSEDLEELQKLLTYYRDVMGQLSTMTEQAEMRTSQIKEEMAKVERIQNIIDEFKRQIVHVQNVMEQKKNEFDALVLQQEQRLAVRMDNSVSEAKERVDTLLASALDHTDLSFQTMIATVQAFLSELNSRTATIEEVVKRLTTTSSETMFSLSNMLDDKRDDLESRARILEELSAKREEMEIQIAALTERKDALDSEQKLADQELEKTKLQLDELRERFLSSKEDVAAAVKESSNPMVDKIIPVVEEKTSDLDVLYPKDEEYDLLDEYEEEPLGSDEFDQTLDDDYLDMLDDETDVDEEDLPFEENLDSEEESLYQEQADEFELDFDETDETSGEDDTIAVERDEKEYSAKSEPVEDVKEQIVPDTTNDIDDLLIEPDEFEGSESEDDVRTVQEPNKPKAFEKIERIIEPDELEDGEEEILLEDEEDSDKR